jgi:hypothetical protein
LTAQPHAHVRFRRAIERRALWVRSLINDCVHDGGIARYFFSAIGDGEVDGPHAVRGREDGPHCDHSMSPSGSGLISRISLLAGWEPTKTRASRYFVGAATLTGITECPMLVLRDTRISWGGIPLRTVEPESAGTTSIYDEAGQKIANVLRAAEENAVELLASAREDARVIRDQAEREAQEARAQLAAEVAERRTEAELVRAEANRYAEERRLTADREARQAQAEAQAEVRLLRESGEELRQYFGETSEVLARLLGVYEPELEEQLVAEVRARSGSVSTRDPGDPPRLDSN